MIGTCSRCKKKNQEVEKVDHFQLCKKCYGMADDTVKEKYKRKY